MAMLSAGARAFAGAITPAFTNGTTSASTANGGAAFNHYGTLPVHGTDGQFPYSIHPQFPFSVPHTVPFPPVGGTSPFLGGPKAPAPNAGSGLGPP